jgi:hypothetical protein
MKELNILNGQAHARQIPNISISMSQSQIADEIRNAEGLDVEDIIVEYLAGNR